MPGFKTTIVHTEVKSNHIEILACIDWFLKNIVIWAELRLPYETVNWVKDVEDISRFCKVYKIPANKIPNYYRWLLSDSMVSSIRTKAEIHVNK